ncbi:serine/threonine-protein kinase ATM [Daucus carota subsp. sativus]|uniref:serine/threonine-protein kinase ATM n=1 Tax=Daucus carota subsp. sativus TaxID=79200 RepID=UPI0007F04786|nr:PREDICTED: serine/threonine-protein kinase ATM isoform X1 [Daucus carota subsp. sativus]XP_017218493.1 PREDICTED: serine/threonine-protein kinase ATM isoform X2 [Daucus carota subsp. sativus]
MIKPTSRDIEEIVSKLSSDTSKAREEGVKLLSTWLEGERSFGFCEYIGKHTAALKPDEVPHAKTWPFLVTLLIRCVTVEVNSTKKSSTKRPSTKKSLPKPSFAKILRVVLQRAENVKFPGSLSILPVAVTQLLFNHILDVLKDVPSFHLEYGALLRHLLASRHYRFHIGRKVYGRLVLLYMEKVETGLGSDDIGQTKTTEEVVRSVQTLHSLLDNPPGDFPDKLQNDIVKGFVRIFLNVRNESKISRKLIDCINTYLLKDGPNLGCQSLEIHHAVQPFIFQCWSTIHDCGDSLILYARLQLNLTRGAADESLLLEQLMDVLGKELDQTHTSSTSALRCGTTRDHKLGNLTTSQHGLLDLAALVFYRACVNTTKAPAAEKRVRREHPEVILKGRLMKGKWLWNATFCYIIRNYRRRLSKDLLVSCFKGLCVSIERIINDATKEHAYDDLLWTLRSLQGLSTVLLVPSVEWDTSSRLSFTVSEVEKGWHTIWNCLIRGLPMFSNVNTVADAAIILLGNIISHVLPDTFTLSEDIWDLRLFKVSPSPSLLCFISCYFSQRGSQGDLRDALHLRQNLLRTTLSVLTWKNTKIFNERMVIYLPAACFALCSGSASFLQCDRDLAIPNFFLDALEMEGELSMAENRDHTICYELYACAPEVLAEINIVSGSKAGQLRPYQSVRLPRQIRDPLLHELEDCILEAVVNEKIENLLLSDVFFISALLSNIMYSSHMTRISKEVSPFLSKIGFYLSDLLECAVSMIQEYFNDIMHKYDSKSSIDRVKSILVSFRSLTSSPLFGIWTVHNVIDVKTRTSINESFKRLLKALAELYDRSISCSDDLQSDIDVPDSSKTYAPDSSQAKSRSKIVDMDLDGDDDGNDIEGSSPASAANLKLHFVSLISNFFAVVPVAAWDVMFNLMEKETDPRALESLLTNLCQHPYWSSDKKLLNLVVSMTGMVDMLEDLKLECLNVVVAISQLLQTLQLSLSTSEKDGNISFNVNQRLSESFISLGDLLRKLAEYDLLDWVGRVKLVDCICNYILLKPQIGQTMVEKLLVMLQDPDYRVRLNLARRIGVLFQTWDGHDELFRDICSNFGVKLVSSKERLVTAAEVIKAGPYAPQKMETIIITLMHLALHSEKMELEAVFIMCAIAAIDPCQRELIGAVLDNLSKTLEYTTRSKYVEELIAHILFSWVACGVSLAALIETRGLFVWNVEPINFIQYCCPWLLPALMVHGDTVNLNWVAKVARKSSADLVRIHFVPIFSVCMALHCSKNSGWESGAALIQSSILSIAEMSESERDQLIKKHMVSIVSNILSLASCASNPALPSFSKDTVVDAIRTVVDGFLETEQCARDFGVLDKINIFRPDRVFMFIVELHYKVTAAVHPRHKSNRLAGIEVLLIILGKRASVSSTSSYLFNMVGQFISCHAIQDQCCSIISTMLKISSPAHKDITRMLGEQLQFLVSKLVECCIPSGTSDQFSTSQSSQVMSLLHQLTVESDPSLHDYIRELQPFPEIDLFDTIRSFHQKLSQNYSPRDHLLKLVRRSWHLPPKFLLCSLQALHRKLFMGYGTNSGIYDETYWHSDNEIARAVWTLVHISSLDYANSFGDLVSDFISKVGIGDPHRVVFHLPGESSRVHVFGQLNCDTSSGKIFQNEPGISEELLKSVLRLLRKYLMDDSVDIIDMTSQVLRGILSTERGQQALRSFDSNERSLIEVHSKGVNLELVQKSVLELDRKFDADEISVKKSDIWKTHGKSFESWICSLVHALIGYCDDIILRLCQDLVLQKAEVAEILFPNVMVNLAGRKNLDFDLCKLISSKVLENIFVESNVMVKSIQVMLNALNEVRLCHVMERTGSSLVPSKRDSLKGTDKPSSYNSRSRSSVKLKDSAATSTDLVISSSLWEKVYWLAIDYLVVAKSAISCGSYFTAVLYVEHWCEENFKCLTLGSPDFSDLELLPHHIEILVTAVTQINEPDSLYGIVQSCKLSSQIITFEHEGNWSKALEYYDLQVRSEPSVPSTKSLPETSHQRDNCSFPLTEDETKIRKPYKGLIRSLQQLGCTHVLDLYSQGLTSRKGRFQHDFEFTELQYEAAWRAGNWDFSLLYDAALYCNSSPQTRSDHFNENLHSCFRALQEGDVKDFHLKLKDSKQELLFSIYHASEESTEYIYAAVVKLQIFHHLGMAWGLRWRSSLSDEMEYSTEKQKLSLEPVIPTTDQLSWLNVEWSCILQGSQYHMNLLEPYIAFRRVLLQVLSCTDCSVQHLLESASTLRKGARLSQAAAALHEFKSLCAGNGITQNNLYLIGRIEEAKLLRAQGQHEMAINLAKYISQNYPSNAGASDVYRLVGKWLAETRSSNSRTILEKYLKHAVTLAEDHMTTDKKSMGRKSQTHFHLAHYTDALFRNCEEILNSNEWQAALRLRKHKTRELEALIRRLKSSSKGDKTDYSIKIQELQKQLSMDKEEAEKLQQDKDNFLSIALEGYKRCLVIGDKYDIRVVFRLISLWFSLSTKPNVVREMLSTINEVQSYKFIPLVYQIASRMGGPKDGQGAQSFQFALVSLLKKMAIDHPYHTVFQLLALANGDRIKDKQRSRNSFVVDMDKKYAAENLLNELSSYHGAVIRQMKQMVDMYIKLAELETKKEDTNKKVTLPRDIRSIRQLELVPVVTSTFPIDHSCQYPEGSFAHFKGLADSVTVMNGINAPKVVECLGSDGNKYRQLAKSGNDDLRQDAVMEQFFGLVNTFLQNHRDTWKRRLRIRTYKVVPFTPSAGVLEWVNGTVPLGEYLIGSMRSGGAHGRYGAGDWTFLKCRHHMATENDKGKAFQEVCKNFRPVMHYFFLERFLHPSDWFEKRLAYTRSVAASSMVGYIVGLGDRHSMNILIDQATAEVVHIDLGVAFEQGLMLKTPERVPFRLTRDIVDGMGITGVEGVFRRCCEETLSVMRTNKEALLTILEVFMHDPLYKWALSPLKALQRQKETYDDLETSLEDSQDEYEGNKDATRALLRVKQKLDGYEEGEMRSVHGQVQQLIQDAIDPDRLCHMFPGWGSWM